MAISLTALPARGYFHACEDGTLQCDVCPRHCRIRDGQAGFCEVREARGGEVRLAHYGQATGLHVEAVERLGLHHFLPGSSVLAFGTSGCNLGCRYCTNPLVHCPPRVKVVQQWASPAFIATAAQHLSVRSVAFAGNDPVVFHEFAVDVADAAHEWGLKTLARTAGYVDAEPRRDLFSRLDAVSVELQGFREDYYDQVCGARLQPVLETAAFVKLETSAWLELAYRLVPGANDSDRELDELTTWIAGQLGPETPLHFGVALSEVAWGGGLAALERARRTARGNGLRHVYLRAGQEPWAEGTDCAACGARVIDRDGDRVTGTLLDGATCRCCGATCAGVFA